VRAQTVQAAAAPIAIVIAELSMIATITWSPASVSPGPIVPAAMTFAAMQASGA
jgi:hypothetical protein